MLQNSIQIISALNSPEVAAFTRSVLIASYEHFFPEHKKEAAAMVTSAFEILKNSQKNGDNTGKLKEATLHINKTIFHKDDPEFWFNRDHKHYKINIRSQEDYRCIEQFIKGKRILDFGSNGGYFALELEKHGYEVMTTDVLDYRDPKAKHLPFRKMATATDIPYEENTADTAVVKTVLHHIDNNNLPKILKNLMKIAGRLIIKEDLYGVNRETQGISPLLALQPELRKFIELSRDDQYLFLVLIDFFGNTVAHGLTEMNLSFDFKTLEEWIRLFAANNLTVKFVKFYGFEKTKLHNSLQVWIVCDRIE